MNEVKRKAPQRRSLDQWRALIDEQAHSGLGQRAFCEARDVSLSSFYSAKQRLASVREATNGDFVPVDLGIGGDSGWQVEVALGEAITLRFYRR